MNRAELHLHTKLSDSVSVIGADEIIANAEQFGISALAFTSLNSVQDFYEIAKHTNETDIKIIYGAEVVCQKGKITLLAKNDDGIKALYRVISSTENGVIDLSVLKENKDNLLVGSAGNEGELFHTVNTAGAERLEDLAGFYDYFEIYPSNDEKDRITNKKIYALGEELGVPVVAVSNAHYLYKNDAVCRDVARALRGLPEEGKDTLFLRTTEELISEFSYLGKNAAEDVAVKYPNFIADLTEKTMPIKEGSFFLKSENDYNDVEKLCYGKAVEIYGNPLPEIVKIRLKTELDLILKNDFASLYLLACKMANNAKESFHLFSVRGAAGSAFVAFLLGISGINPLSPHYYCTECSYFEKTEAAQNGPDLPNKSCPVCGASLKGDGYKIPFESFVGISGDKRPDFEINVAPNARLFVIEYMKKLFGKNRIAFGGTVSTFWESRIKKLLEEYEEVTGRAFTAEQKEYITTKLCKVKSGEGVHPGRIMVIPKDMEFEDFTPLKKNGESINATHFDFLPLQKNILKLSILETGALGLLEALQKKTGINPSQIDINAQVVLEFVKKGDTLCIPEFDYDFINNLILETQPKNIGELIKLCGFAHGLNVWTDNGEYLIDKGVPLARIPALREDIMNDLLSFGASKEDAFRVMEVAQKGLLAKGRLNKEETEHIKKLCRPLGSWYFDFLCKVRYIFPKAHAVFYVANSVRIAYFKKNYPKEFYSAYLECFFEDKKNLAEDELRKYKEINRRLQEL